MCRSTIAINSHVDRSCTCWSGVPKVGWRWGLIEEFISRCSVLAAGCVSCIGVILTSLTPGGCENEI